MDTTLLASSVGYGKQNRCRNNSLDQKDHYAETKGMQRYVYSEKADGGNPPRWILPGAPTALERNTAHAAENTWAVLAGKKIGVQRNMQKQAEFYKTCGGLYHWQETRQR